MTRPTSFVAREIRAALQNSGWLIADKLVRLIAALVVSIWMAREFGPVDFGVFTYSIAFAALFTPLVSLGIDSIVVRDLVRTPERAHHILGTSAVLRVVSSIAAIALCMVVSWWSDSAAQSRVLVAVLSIGFLFAITDIIDLWFQSRVEARAIVWGRMPSLVVGLLVRLYFLSSGAPLLLFACVQVGELLMAAAGMSLVYFRQRGDIGMWRIDLQYLRQLIWEAWPLMLAGLSVTLYMRIDVVMLEYMSSAAEVGIYGAATRVSECFYFLPMTIVSSFAPLTVKMMQESRIRHESSFYRLYLLMTRLSVSAAVTVTIAAPLVIDTLFGEAYAPAAAVLQVHVWAAVPVFLGVASSQYLTNEGLQLISLYRTLGGLVLNIFLNILWIPEHGAIGAAAATLVSYSLATFWLGLFARTRGQCMFLFKALDPRAICGFKS